METTFVPCGGNKLDELNLNWKVRLLIGDRKKPVLETIYMAGVGHCPSYKQRPTIDEFERIKRECQTGRLEGKFAGKLIQPHLTDVICCLLMDAEAIDHANFEQWASEFGYDADSRKAEATYRACVETGLSLRAALGEQGLAKLREAFIDY